MELVSKSKFFCQNMLLKTMLLKISIYLRTAQAHTIVHETYAAKTYIRFNTETRYRQIK